MYRRPGSDRLGGVRIGGHLRADARPSCAQAGCGDPPGHQGTIRGDLEDNAGPALEHDRAALAVADLIREAVA